MNKTLLLITSILFINGSIFSQESLHGHHHHDDFEFVDPGHMTCGKEEFTERLFKMYPEERQLAIEAAKKLEEETKVYAESKDTDDEVIIIPVVFHVVHVGGQENISDEQIQSAIDVLNEDFNAANSDIGQVVDEFADIVGDAEMEFRLAKIDPDGNCTNGIDRVFSEYTDEGFNNMKEAAEIWDRSSYLNIWSCRQIGEGTAGYSYPPSAVNGPFGVLYDGIVILHNYVGRIGTSNATRSHALSHEVGHWANLEHPWGVTNNPGIASNCNDDDGVADTPNTIGWTNCDLDGSTCGSLDNVENFMDYSYCYKMFTQGQRTRMRAAMNSSIAQRNQLYTSQNLAETGVLNPDEICFAEFETDRDPKICLGQEIVFDDISFNGVEEWSWIFEGGTPSTSDEESPTVVYNSTGTFNVSLTVTNAQGELSITKENLVNVIEGPQYVLPYEEGFESFDDVEDGNEWVDVNQDDSNISWKITENAAYSGSQSVYVRGRNNTDYQTEILESPTYDLTDIEDNAVLSFYYAHARRNSASDDLFRVRISRNCGESWNVRETREIDELPTVSGSTSSQFVPDSQDEWEEIIIDNISSIFLTDQFRIRFEFTSVNGNNIYVDNINIFDPNTLSTEEISALKDLSIYPNPAKESLRLNIDLTKPQKVRIDLLDASGRIVQSPFFGIMASGSQNLDISLDNTLAAGMYYIRLTGDEGISTRKLIIQ